MLNLKDYIRNIPDFPMPGILFRDITPLLKEPKALRFVIDRFAKATLELKVDAVVGIESRGFIFGAPLAHELNLPFIPVRKPGKLPSERMSVEYSLEYGSSQLDIHKDALLRGQKVVIVDDLLATGGTVRASAKLVEMLEASVSSMLFVVELSALRGREHLKGYEITSLVTY